MKINIKNRVKTMQIIDETIREDIEKFNDQISKAQAKLAALPATAGTYKDRMKLKAKRKALVDDISHVRGLIRVSLPMFSLKKVIFLVFPGKDKTAVK